MIVREMVFGQASLLNLLGSGRVSLRMDHGIEDSQMSTQS
jgi:hypothetical protein